MMNPEEEKLLEKYRRLTVLNKYIALSYLQGAYDIQENMMYQFVTNRQQSEITCPEQKVEVAV